jgi:hypothetical protein
MAETLNTERFVKLLALAESSEDGEALAAVRKAAALAQAAGMSLGQAVEGMGKPGNFWQPPPRRHAVDENAVWEAFERGRYVGYLEGTRNAERAAKDREERRLSRDELISRTRWEGELHGRAKARAEFEQCDIYKTAYKDGFSAGLDSERAATVAAYNRGRKDEAAEREIRERRERRSRRTTAKG